MLFARLLKGPLAISDQSGCLFFILLQFKIISQFCVGHELIFCFLGVFKPQKHVITSSRVNFGQSCVLDFALLIGQEFSGLAEGIISFTLSRKFDFVVLLEIDGKHKWLLFLDDILDIPAFVGLALLRKIR